MALFNEAGTVGVNAAVMSDSQSNLSNHSQTIADLIDDLEGLKNQLPSHWEGDDLELFTAQFVDFKNKLSELPGVITSIVNWAGNTTDDYLANQAKNLSDFIDIYNGGQR